MEENEASGSQRERDAEREQQAAPERGGRRRRPVALITIAAAAVLAGTWVATVGVTAAAGPGQARYATSGGSHTTMPTDSPAATGIRARIETLRALEARAVRQQDFQAVQGLDAEIARAKRQLESATAAPMSRVGSAAAATRVTGPVSTGGVFSDSRDTAFEVALTA